MERDSRLSVLGKCFWQSRQSFPGNKGYTKKAPLKRGAGVVADYFFVTFLGSLAGSVFACSAASAFLPL